MLTKRRTGKNSARHFFVGSHNLGPPTQGVVYHQTQPLGSVSWHVTVILQASSTTTALHSRLFAAVLF
ncbi:hypothetical protein BC629DRAFT_1525225 [Irpex lacteus]|nr:hypothetical protein BC629DRAFT_1525225 [Irpex lacteus]